MKRIVDPEKIGKIAVFRTDRIGEVLLATPVIEALKKRFPPAGISFVTSSYARDVVSERPDLEEIITFDTIERKVPLKEAFSLARNLKERGFDMAVVLNPHKILHLGIFLAGIRYRVGFNRKWGFLLNCSMDDTRDQGNRHEVNYNLRLLEVIGIRAKDIAPFINTSSRDEYYADGLLQQCSVDPGKNTIILHPGTSNPAKQWPIQNFRELAEKLASDGRFNVIVIGDRSEKKLCEVVVAGTSNKALNLAGLFTLKQLAALLKKADILVTNDNGPMHMAAAVGTKVIAIFGRSIPGVGPKRWGPFGQGHVVFHKDPGCDPCLDRDCKYEFKCLTSITPDHIFQAILGTPTCR